MKEILSSLTRQHLAPLLLGVASFFLVVGPRALDPRNIAWLGSGDPTTHFLGWHFFRNSEWSFPIGLNPDFGIELSNAIVYSDSNPLLAFLFKPFSDFLPEVFQYFGLWLLACFVLQAWVGWKLVGLITRHQVIRVLGAGFFVFSPPMIWRLQGHLSLVGHFLVLAALYLALKPRIERRVLAWAVLLSIAALVHAYLLAMVGVIWLADIAGKFAIEKRPLSTPVRELIGVGLVLGFVCWLTGYFSVGRGVAAEGYGYYRMNLLSMFDASGWSYVLKDIPEAAGDYEGFNFLGLGSIALAVWAIPILVAGHVNLWSVARKKSVLLLALLGLTLFALSNNVGIGTSGFQYPLPELMLRGANMFRSSGRMFWPVFYALLLLLLFVVIRGNETRPAIFILALALVLQIVDTSAAWGGIRAKMMAERAAEWSTSLKDPFWENAARHYKRVRWIQPGNHTPNWQMLAAFAGKYHMATDAVYLARISQSAVENAKNKARGTLRTGHYEPDALYILDEAVWRSAALTLNTESDLLARIDGLSVVAPGWKKCGRCAKVQGEARPTDMLPPIRLGGRLQFRQSGNGLVYLVEGWSGPEPWGTWSEGASAAVILPMNDNLKMVVIEADALVTPAHPEQRIRVLLNGVSVKDATLTSSTGNRIEVSISDKLRTHLSENGYLRMQFEIPDAAKPADLGINDDNRILGFGLVSITLQ